MKEIKAIIQPFMLSKVIDALKDIPDMTGVTVSEVKGFGKSRAENVSNAIVEWGVTFVEKVKLETVISDEMAVPCYRGDSKIHSYGKCGRWKNLCLPRDSSHQDSYI